MEIASQMMGAKLVGPANCTPGIAALVRSVPANRTPKIALHAIGEQPPGGCRASRSSGVAELAYQVRYSCTAQALPGTLYTGVDLRRHRSVPDIA
eukprot:2637732-Rhodomonas_salina.1